MVTPGLRKWFVVHFAIDMAFAIPMFFAPYWILGLLGWTTIDPIATRIAAAALFGIGIESLLARNASAESFLTMLNLKLVWSFTGGVGTVWGILELGGPPLAWSLVAMWVGFHLLWLYYRITLGRSLAAPAPAT